MMPGPILGPFVTAGSLPGLAPLTGLPSSFLTAEELKYADIRNIGAMITPLHFLEVKPGKRTQPVKSELDKEEAEKRRWEKNKVGQPDAETRRKSRRLSAGKSELLELINRSRNPPPCIIRTEQVLDPRLRRQPTAEQLEKK
uniref:Jun dimerization protein 2 n=1 Tax=Myotis lucifugus TaxID=59463 RepID=G1QA24_MYOLU